MRKYLAFCIVSCIMLLCSSVFAAYPYDAVGNVSAGGSGTMVYTSVDGRGLVLTNAHVVATVDRTKVRWGIHSRTCWTVFVSYEHDLALMVCKNPPVKAVPHREPVGNFVVSTGYPYYERAFLHWQMSIALRQEDDILWVTHRPVAGMSGGGAFDHEGYLIGVVSRHNDDDGGLISGPNLQKILEKYRDTQIWLPNRDHVQEPQDYDFSPMSGEVRSIKYNPLTAPELPWPGK